MRLNSLIVSRHSSRATLYRAGIKCNKDAEKKLHFITKTNRCHCHYKIAHTSRCSTSKNESECEVVVQQTYSPPFYRCAIDWEKLLLNLCCLKVLLPLNGCWKRLEIEEEEENWRQRRKDKESGVHFFAATPLFAFTSHCFLCVCVCVCCIEQLSVFRSFRNREKKSFSTPQKKELHTDWTSEKRKGK